MSRLAPPGSELPENQFERTLLAWRRTMILLLVVLGIGGIHITLEDHPRLGVVAGLFSLVAIVPMLDRKRQLRRHDPHPMTWQPVVLVVGLVALTASLMIWD